MAWDTKKLANIKPNNAAGWAYSPYYGMAQAGTGLLDNITGSDWQGALDGLGGKASAAFDPSTHEQDKAALAAIEGAKADIDALQVPELGTYTPDLYQWLGDYAAQDIDAPQALTAQTVTARPDVAYQAAQAAPDVQAERIAANKASAAQMGRTAMQDVVADPRMKEAQMAALTSMQDIGANGGMTDMERAQLNRTQSEVAQADRGRREAILQGMRARGMAGSGNELLAQLSSSQAATDRANQAGLDINGAAQARALQALQQAGAMAGGMRSQGFGEDAARAEAMDAVARFNAANSQQANLYNAGVLNDTARFNSGQGLQAQQFNAGQRNNMSQFNTGNQLRADMGNRDYATDVEKYNTGAANQFAQYNADNTLKAGMYNNDWANKAGMANWQGAQASANANTDTKNKAGYYNTVERPQQQYGMAANKAGMKAGLAGKQADFYTAQGDRKAREQGGMLGGAMGALGAIGAAALSDKRAKTDIKPMNNDAVDKFLRNLKPKTYRYKSRVSDDTDPKVGFVMQDIDDTEIGKIVERDLPGGLKGYDPQSMQGVILAALKDLAEKVDKKG